MKRFLLLVFLLSITANTSYAKENNLDVKTLNIVNYNSTINREDIFVFLSSYYDEVIPSTYKYIKLNFTDVNEGDTIYESLQKLVYLDLIKNQKLRIHANKNLTAYAFYRLANKILKTKFSNEESLKSLKYRMTSKNDLDKIKDKFNIDLVDFETINSNEYKINIKKSIFKDVYNNLINNHYDNDSLDKSELLEGAIEGIAKGVGDKYTVYFPPTDSKDFYESLNGEYEGIGSYVDMEVPGKVRIVSPIPGSPSEKAGLKGGDLIIKVDGKTITKENSLTEVVSWIKGPAGTKVLLAIKRKNKTLLIEVDRAKIVLKDVEYRLLDRNTYLIEIKTFGDLSSSGFKEAIENLKTYTKVKKVIIDLRNNGGGYLGEVSNMLGYFLDAGDATAIVKYKSNTKNYYSAGYDLIDFSKYKLVLLQNSGTASASEIMIGTLKDYFPDSIIIGEKSYGKGSVQTIRSYEDGSTLKYTIAKWFTGKKEIGIDGVGIMPDIELEFDRELYKKDGSDNQLNKAKFIN